MQYTFGQFSVPQAPENQTTLKISSIWNFLEWEKHRAVGIMQTENDLQARGEGWFFLKDLYKLEHGRSVHVE